MKRLAATALLTVCAAASAYAGPPVVDEVALEGPVTPVMASYLERGIEEAHRDGAALLLVRLNTPGGSIDLMTRMSEAMTRSSVPIAVWVAPRGAMAASAGTFLVLSGHVAAMAPSTVIGAASPVDGEGKDLDSTLEHKIKSVMSAQIRQLAARRGERAVQWAERAVNDAVSATPEEALAMGAIDLVAAERGELLGKLEGRNVDLVDESVALHLLGAEVHEIEMTWVEDFLHTISNPSIAFILLMLGLNGILFELSSPGTIVPGVVGAIALLLAFYSLGHLPVNYAGLLLILLAFALFIFDVKASSHGVLTAGGIAALVFGAMILFQSPIYAVPRPVVIAVAVVTGLFFAFVVAAAVRAQRRKPTTGVEGLLGARGTSRTPLAPAGMVMVEGELWQATADAAPLDAGVPVEVVAVDGLSLRVRRA